MGGIGNLLGRLAGNPKVLALLANAKSAGTAATPFLGRASQALQNPWTRSAIGGTLGAATNNEGTIGGRIRGGLVGGTLGAAAGPAGQSWATGGLTRLGVPLATAGPIANVAVPAAGILMAGNQAQGTVGNQVANTVQGGAGNVANTGVIMQQHQPNVSGGYIGGPGGGAGGGYGGGGQGPVPVLGGAHGRMVQGPDGSIWQEIDPTGWKQGMRVGSGLDTQQNISNANRWFESRFPQSEMVKKADFERELAALQLGENIKMARTMMEGTHAGNVNIAEQAGADMGQLLNSRYQYF